MFERSRTRKRRKTRSGQGETHRSPREDQKTFARKQIEGAEEEASEEVQLLLQKQINEPRMVVDERVKRAGEKRK